MYHLFRALDHKNEYFIWQIVRKHLYFEKIQTNIQFSLIQYEHWMEHNFYEIISQIPSKSS